MLKIEKVQDCKLVRKGSKDCGHDCWGNLEWVSYKYVIIGGEIQECWDNWYVVHDGKDVKKVISKFIMELQKSEAENLEKTGFRTSAEYAAYLKGVEDGKNGKV